MIPRELWLFVLAVSTVLAGPYPNFRTEFDFVGLSGEKEWWQTATFYQIYPRSFKDTDGDGIGDLQGITDNLAYLKEIGVTATWLSPIFKSPMKDFGYDISNFYEIQEEYGTMKDFENLIARANQLGIKIILDFVPNHSSNENEWFKLSELGNKTYEDFYVWHPGYPDEKDPNKRRPPSNWVSVFRKSAWQWSDIRKQFYLHQFAVAQPDLNYRNEKVREEMKNVLRFWLNKGVHGFRVDAVPHVFECQRGDNPFPDEPRNPSVTDPDDYGYLNHDCTKDQPETLELLYEWRKVIDEYKEKGEPRILMTEAYSDMQTLMKYYGVSGKEGAQIPFNFLLITNLQKSSTAKDLVNTINDWLTNMPKGRTANWVIGNHDQSRVGSRFGEKRIDLMNMIVHTLPGVGVTYNGEEIGMTDVWISWNDTVDPAACNSNPDIYERFTRDPERTPFQWSDEKNAGFSTGDKTWLPVAPNYKEVNVQVQRRFPKSHLNTYKRIQALRRTKTLMDGETKVIQLSPDVVGILRQLRGEPSYVTVVNWRDQIETVDISKLDELLTNMEYVVVNDQSSRRIGETTSTKNFVLGPYEAVILKSKTKLTSVAGYYFYESK